MHVWWTTCICSISGRYEQRVNLHVQVRLWTLKFHNPKRPKTCSIQLILKKWDLFHWEPVSGIGLLCDFKRLKNSAAENIPRDTLIQESTFDILTVSFNRVCRNVGLKVHGHLLIMLNKSFGLVKRDVAWITKCQKTVEWKFFVQFKIFALYDINYIHIIWTIFVNK